MLTSIDHINIVVEDLEKAKNFFTTIGFTLEHEDDLEGEWISKIVRLPKVRARYAKLVLPGDTCRLELVTYYSPEMQSETLANQANRLGYRHIAFRVEDISSVVAKLQVMDVEFFSDVHVYEPTNKKLVYLLGPEGILLELAEYGS